MYTLHLIPDWASTVPRLALEELGLPYQLQVHDHRKGSLRTAEYLRINPNGLIPSLETSDGPLFETGAIMLWLVDQHGGLGPAHGTPERTAFLAWLFFMANTVHPNVMALIHPERLAGEENSLQAAELAQARLRGAFARLEDAAETTRWISASQPSAITLYLAVMLRWAKMLPSLPSLQIDTREFPKLRAIAQAVEGRPAALHVAAAEGLGATAFSDPAI